jgi:hypothetical protein
MRWVVVSVIIATMSAACSDDEGGDACGHGDSAKGEVGDTAEVQLADDGMGWVDVFGEFWDPIGRDDPPEGPAAVTLTAEARLAVVAEDGSTFTFAIVQCG